MNRIDEVLISLRRVTRAIDLHSKHLMKTAGLTAPQMLILQTLRDQGDAIISDVAHQISLSQATVTSILDRLEKRGLVMRERSQQDKRKVYACLTDAGNDLIRNAPMPLQDYFIRQFSDLQDWEQTQIISALQRVAHMMDAQHIDAAPLLDVGAIDRQSEEENRTFGFDNKEV
ncbi:MAG: DNA-binding MarR family transcriptional regulator [Zhongshania marina]|jgi:DNA-binding MarR family transcriptional regulator|uniref:Transcriptional regulator n=1 Tax=Zhongshania marina TaxID=2304603 RepID=A0A2S4HDB5_9GAMM|nr:MarR family transcriptional regulator [Marortus luteolus]POP51992.1 transcriptional regulator [Marortus luteolus]RNL66364.1 MarR family transcriptional regulator [Zhongshania marina]|tara:strand:+ start:460 stop:978 length:519 start_codon:yes stop_codon:yes gene_type:complete